MAQQDTKNVKQTLPYLGNAAQAKSMKVKGTRREETLIHALEKRLREREKERTTMEGLGPLSTKHYPL